MKKALKLIGLILIVIVVAICAAVAVFWYSKEHWSLLKYLKRI